jgi:carbon monoxide dehydrogenase subunit G
MLPIILIGAAVAIAVFVVVVALKRPDFRIARSATIEAPPEVVFEQINDFHKWRAWSPWEKKDPALRRTYEGPAEGAGAVYAWAGNKEVGEGRMTLVESRPDELLRIKLEFFKPFVATNYAEFALEPSGEQTRVTWAMTGKNGFIAKAFCMFVDMDKMVGGDFEKGLAALKNVAERQTVTALATAS